MMLLSSLSVGLVLVSAAVKNWADNPEKVAIKTFSKPAKEVPYPAITICNPNSYDVGEYIRAVFDNFEYSCKMDKCAKSRSLRTDFPGFSDESHSGGMVRQVSLRAKDITIIAQRMSFQVDNILNRLSSFPYEAKQTFWEKKQDTSRREDLSICMGKMQSLVTHYFTPNGSIGTTESIYRHLFGDPIAGKDNNKEWQEIMDVQFGGCPYHAGIGTNSTPEDCIVSEI